jgi:hypothetical protein
MKKKTLKKKKQKHTRTKNEFRDNFVVETKDFAGEIEKGADGKNKLKVSSPIFYQHQLNKFKAGEKVSLYISSKRPKRSERQNRYYWGAYLPIIAEETGERNIQKLHELFSGMFLTEGVYNVLGRSVRLKKSTTELNKSEFSQYIMDIEAETGIEAPPTENYFDK